MSTLRDVIVPVTEGRRGLTMRFDNIGFGLIPQDEHRKEGQL